MRLKLFFKMCSIFLRGIVAVENEASFAKNITKESSFKFEFASHLSFANIKLEVLQPWA